MIFKNINSGLLAALAVVCTVSVAPSSAAAMQVNLGSGGPTSVFDGHLDLALTNRFDVPAAFGVTVYTKDGALLVAGEDYRVREPEYHLEPLEQTLIQLQFRSGNAIGKLRVCISTTEYNHVQNTSISTCGRYIVHGYGGSR